MPHITQKSTGTGAGLPHRQSAEAEAEAEAAVESQRGTTKEQKSRLCIDTGRRSN